MPPTRRTAARRPGEPPTGAPPQPPRLPAELTPAEPGDLAEPRWEGRLVTGLNLPGFDAAEIAIDGSRLTRVRLPGAVVDAGAWRDVEVDEADLAALRGHRWRATRVLLRGVRLTGAQITQATLTDLDVVGGRWDETALRSASLVRGRFTGVDLRGADFGGTDLSGALFVDCDLTGARFANATCRGVRFERCRLVDVHGAEGLRGAIVPAADLLDLATSLAAALGVQVE